jgi:hypothetical protein
MGLGAGFKGFTGMLSPLGIGFSAAVGGKENVRQARGYMAQQRAGTRHVRAPEAAGEIPTMQKISARKALRFYMRKHAVIIPPPAATGLAGNLARAMLMGAAGTGAAMLMGSGISGVGGVFQKYQAGRMFQELQTRYPEIKQHPKAREYFDMIVAYAPSLLRHHAAVGDFLRRQLEYPMSSVEFLKQLADLEGQVVKSQNESAGARFGQTMSTTAPRWMESSIKSTAPPRAAPKPW